MKKRKFSKKLTLNVSDLRIKQMKTWRLSQVLGYLMKVLETLSAMIADKENPASIGLKERVGYFLLSTWGRLPAQAQLELFEVYKTLHPDPGNRLWSAFQKWDVEKVRQRAKDEAKDAELRSALIEAVKGVSGEERINAVRKEIRKAFGRQHLDGKRFRFSAAFLKAKFPKEHIALMQNRPVRRIVRQKARKRASDDRASRTSETLADQLQRLSREGRVAVTDGVVASSRGTVYHREDSAEARAIKQEHRRHFFSADEAEKAGFVPSAQFVRQELAA